MIYTPHKNPTESIILVSLVVLVGVLVGYFISDYFTSFALIFWMLYTAVLSYIQFKHHSEHSYKGFTEIILHPQIKFFIFEFIAFLGLGAIVLYNNIQIGMITLIVWWLLSMNFYIYYKRRTEK